MHRRHPRFLLGILIEHRFLLFSVEREFDLLEILLACETTCIEDFVVIWPNFWGTLFLHRSDEIFSLVFHESVGGWLVEHRDVRFAYFLCIFLTCCDDIVHLNS